MNGECTDMRLKVLFQRVSHVSSDLLIVIKNSEEDYSPDCGRKTVALVKGTEFK